MAPSNGGGRPSLGPKPKPAAALSENGPRGTIRSRTLMTVIIPRRMGELGAFLKIHRVGFDKRDPARRVGDYAQYFSLQPESELRRQGARCMDCGVPFCHEGCPLGNLIPDWNDLVYRDKWREAIEQLHATNNFPEFTGLICPAPCESACVLKINDDAVAIEQIELSIISRAFDEGWVVAEPPDRRSGRTVAVVGSGPAGLAVAAELNKSGHLVTVYERDEGPGGLLRFGVPDAKLEKSIIDRRVALLAEEGIEFVYDCEVGSDFTAAQLQERHDAVVLSIGSRVSRSLDVVNNHLPGIHPAMDYLYQRNRWVAAEQNRPSRTPEQAGIDEITAAGKKVIVIGGGDTGMDCISNSHREGAASVIMLDVYAQLPDGDDPRTPWPLPPKRNREHVRAGGGGPSALGHGGDRLRRQGRARQPRLRAAGDRQVLAGPHPGAGQRVRARGRSGARRDRFPPPRARRDRRAARHRHRLPRQPHDPSDVPHVGGPRLRLWRCPHRAVPGGERDRGGPQVRARRQRRPRRLTDGRRS